MDNKMNVQYLSISVQEKSDGLTTVILCQNKLQVYKAVDSERSILLKGNERDEYLDTLIEKLVSLK